VAADPGIELDRAERIGEVWSYPQTRTFAELLPLSDPRKRSTSEHEAAKPQHSSDEWREVLAQ
jgi:hypothetical protein